MRNSPPSARADRRAGRRSPPWLALPIALCLLLFNARRLVFTWAALTANARRGARNPNSAIFSRPSVLVLVPCRDEAAALPGLIACLERLAYPADRLQVTLIDDGSTDGTRELIARAAQHHAGWRAMCFDANRGKAQALNEALARIAFGDVVVVYDADHRPEPDSAQRLAAAFDDPAVAGASGRTRIRNALTSLPAYYAAVESMAHQLITMRAKDALGLAPALLGSNCAYRRSALVEAGGFRPGALLEDSDLTLAFARLGRRLRFVPEAVAWHQAPETVAGYIRQHARWARGFNDVAHDHVSGTLTDVRLTLPLRAELLLFSAGYLDRLALLAGMGIRMLSRGRGGLGGAVIEPVLRLSLLMPLLQVMTAFILDRAPRGMWLRLPAIPLLFSLDVFAAARAMIESVLNRPRVWARTVRSNG